MLQKATDTPGNTDWVKKILRESIYVDICEAEKTLSHKDIILDEIDYTVKWRNAKEKAGKNKKTRDRIVVNLASGTAKRRKKK